MKSKISIVFFTAVVFICCKTTSSTTASAPPKVNLVPGQTDEVFAKTKWPDTDLAQLTSGYKIYTANCGRCHELHGPTEYDEVRWTKIVPWMGKKAELNEADQKLILHYLLTKREVLKELK